MIAKFMPIAFLLLAGAVNSAARANDPANEISKEPSTKQLEGCYLLSFNDARRLQMPINASAKGDWSEKDQLHICGYASSAGFRMVVAYGKPAGDQLQQVQALIDKTKAALRDSPLSTEGAVDDFSMCAMSQHAEGHRIACSGIKQASFLTLVIIRSKGLEPPQISAAAYLQLFNTFLAKVPT